MATCTVANAEKTPDRTFKTLTGQLPVQLRFKRATKRNTEYPGLRLPFTSIEGLGCANFWALPETEGYTSGCDLGNYAAIAYLRALHTAPKHCHGLASVVQSVAEAHGAKLTASQCGAIVGFFGTVQRWLDFALASAGNQLLDGITDAELEFRMSYAASLTKAQADDGVRRAAQAHGLELES